MIAITCQSPKGFNRYKEAIKGLNIKTSFLTPRSAKNLDKFKGFIIAGGGDIQTSYYSPGEPINPKVNGIEPERDILEARVINYAYENNKPLLGICRGMQMMNCVFGGTLYQDIDDLFPCPDTGKNHKNNNKNKTEMLKHEIILSPNSILYSIFKKKKMIVTSSHHQAVKIVPNNLVVTGISNDGLVEVIEDPKKDFFLGVQFHPETMIESIPEIKNLFANFVEVCIKNA